MMPEDQMPEEGPGPVELDQPVQIAGEFYNVAEQWSMYDSIAVTQNLPNLSKQPPGWFQTFAAMSGATNLSFFNVRNSANCDRAYCNQDSRDVTAFAFQIDSYSLSWWGAGFQWQNIDNDLGVLAFNRSPLPNAFWQADLPFECSWTLRIQQDEKAKHNAMQVSPGFGPVGDGWGALGGLQPAAIVGTQYPAYGCLTQGVPSPAAKIKLPTLFDVPRRAFMSAELSFTPYGRAVLAAMPGPGYVSEWVPGWQSQAKIPVMFGITCALHGRRLVQQRGALHA